MKYLEEAFKFLGKNYIIALPLVVLSAIANIFVVIGSTGVSKNMMEFVTKYSNQMMSGSMDYYDSTAFMNEYINMLTSGSFGWLVFGGILSIIFAIIYLPITYGLVNKTMETGKADLKDTGEVLTKNVGKYLLMILLSLGAGVAFSIIFGVIFAVLIAISTVTPIVILIIVLLALALLVFSIFISIKLSLWFTAMVVENLSLIDALKKSFRTTKGRFWPILGITLLVQICGSVVGMLFSLFNLIPIVGAVISSLVPSSVAFIMIVYYIALYRDANGINAQLPVEINEL